MLTDSFNKSVCYLPLLILELLWGGRDILRIILSTSCEFMLQIFSKHFFSIYLIWSIKPPAPIWQMTFSGWGFIKILYDESKCLIVLYHYLCAQSLFWSGSLFGRGLNRTLTVYQYHLASLFNVVIPGPSWHTTLEQCCMDVVTMSKR